MKGFLWIVASLFVPLLLTPTILLIRLSTGERWDAVQRWMRDSIGDGQLLWAAIGIGSVSIYDGWYAPTSGDRAWLNLALLVLGLVVLIALLMVQDATRKILDFQEALRAARKQSQGQAAAALPEKNLGPLVACSIVISAVVCILALCVRFVLT